LLSILTLEPGTARHERRERMAATCLLLDGVGG
jgi:hypothetical protein